MELQRDISGDGLTWVRDTEFDRWQGGSISYAHLFAKFTRIVAIHDDGTRQILSIGERVGDTVHWQNVAAPVGLPANPYSHHPVLDPNPRKGTRLAEVGLNKPTWDSADDATFGQLVAPVTRCTQCGCYLPATYATVAVLPLDDPDWPFISFESTKVCSHCGATNREYT